MISDDARSMKKGKRGAEIESEWGDGKGCFRQDGKKRPHGEGGI